MAAITTTTARPAHRISIGGLKPLSRQARRSSWTQELAAVHERHSAVRCTCAIDEIALLERLGFAMDGSSRDLVMAAIPLIIERPSSEAASHRRCLAAMDWFVHRFGPDLLRDLGHTWVAEELEQTPRTTDTQTLERAINTCSSVTYLVEDACTAIFRSGYRAGAVLAQMMDNDAPRKRTFGKLLGSSIVSAATTIYRSPMTIRSSERPRSGKWGIEAVEWPELLDRLLAS